MEGSGGERRGEEKDSAPIFVPRAHARSLYPSYSTGSRGNEIETRRGSDCVLRFPFVIEHKIQDRGPV